MKKATFTGTVISGTMRSEDLIPAFMDVLTEFDPETAAKIQVELDQAEGNDEELDMILNEDLWDAMYNIAPDGYYFGAHPGDGSDYGFWQGEDEDLD